MSKESTIYDVIVVGAGVEGSATAFQLSKQHGVKCLLLDQFPLPHTRGSSHGGSRITRKCYPQAYYVEMMNYNMAEWKRIEEVTGLKLFNNVGYLDIGPPSHPHIQADVGAMKANNAPYELLSPIEFKKRYPNLRYDNHTGAVLDINGGVLAADKCLRALQRLFQEQGGTIMDAQRVKRIIPGETIQIITDTHSFTCRSSVLCCGPWTNRILGMGLDLKLPLEPQRMSVCYWPEKEPGSEWSTYNIAFSDRVEKPDRSPYNMYGMVNPEYPDTFKLCYHVGPEVDPERRDTVDSKWVLDTVKEYVRLHFPGLVPEPSIVEACFYTITPDSRYILDYHPRWKNIVIGAGFSGHGFKMAPAVGNILSDLVLHQKPTHDVTPFKLNRFDVPPKSKI